MITEVNDFCVRIFTMENFGDWLLKELREAKISQSEFSRRSGLSKGTISNLINGTKGAGQDSLIAIARALKLPTDLVFEKAGLLPPKVELSPIKRKLAHLAENLPDSDLEMVIALLEQRQNYYKKSQSVKPAK